MANHGPETVTGAERAHDTFKDSFSYSNYLRIEQLLGAQAPLTTAHDESLFITIHHVQEVWMSLIIKELQGGFEITGGEFRHRALQLFNDEAHPHFLNVMDGDEERLIVRVGERGLRRKQLLDAQIV